jgi:tyrosinase
MFCYYDQCMATSRCPPPTTDPVSNVWINGVENNDQVAENLRDNSVNADPPGEAVYRLFSEDYFANYDAFASTRYTEGQPPPDYLSSEGIHKYVFDHTNSRENGIVNDYHFSAIFILG